MKRLFIILILLSQFAISKPWTHDFKSWMEKTQLIDGFSIYHAGIGGVKSVINEWFWAYNERVGGIVIYLPVYAHKGWRQYAIVFAEPSAWTKVKRNFYWAVLWEIGEFGVEGHWDYDYYMDFYGGNFWYNNLMDIALDCAVFSIPHYKGMYYDFKIWKHELRANFSLEPVRTYSGNTLMLNVDLRM